MADLSIIMKADAGTGNWLFNFEVPGVGRIARGEIAGEVEASGKRTPLAKEVAIDRIRQIGKLLAEADPKP